jgi:Ser/Thr protein kinase RdoA (MazF antagonist)
MCRVSPHTNSPPVTHSVLDPAGLAAVVQSCYDIGRAEACTFLKLGLNDTYRVDTATGPFIFRIYRAGWRSWADILYELDLLRHLAASDVQVSLPVATRDGTLLHTVRAPEGERYAVLFTQAPGSVRPPDEQASERYGRLAGTLHDALDGFATPHARTALDQELLLDTPLARLRPFLAHRVEDGAYLEALADRLRARLSDLVADLDHGPCHGDFHWWNLHVAEDDTATLFDFDCCGPGWRSYDIAIYRWGTAHDNAATAEENWEAFVRGYTARRPLGAADIAAVSIFVALRHFWVLGMRTEMANLFGSVAMLNEVSLAEHVAFLRDWDARYLSNE